MTILERAAAAFAVLLLLSAAAIDSAYAQEESSTNLRLIPSQERIPQPDEQPYINPEYIIPPIDSPPSSAPPVVRNSPPFKAPLVSSLERGKWYVQIGVYSEADHVENAINRVGTASPMVIQNIGTDTTPTFRVLLGPFSQNEGKTMLQRFRNKGYDVFLRSGN
jgi:cell division septation protein DedD